MLTATTLTLNSSEIALAIVALLADPTTEKVYLPSAARVKAFSVTCGFKRKLFNIVEIFLFVIPTGVEGSFNVGIFYYEKIPRLHFVTLGMTDWVVFLH
jgi:hypothetical protein